MTSDHLFFFLAVGLVIAVLAWWIWMGVTKRETFIQMGWKVKEVNNPTMFAIALAVNVVLLIGLIVGAILFAS